MRTLVGLVVFALMLASCSQYTCPTYSRSKKHGNATVSARKGKPAKNGATPYYKTLRVAEED